jgi:EAL domain-containing protein (putative c-di-GMP-specific phosphodiesterase class I)
MSASQEISADVPTVNPLALELRIHYQPLVHLESGDIVGYEALVRGPKGSPWERPDVLFDLAHRRGISAEFDWACRTLAFDGAVRAGVRPPAVVFVNTEPEHADSQPPRRHGLALARAHRELKVVYELTERALTAKPAELLRMVEQIREKGWGVALDDVGTDWRSLALMPFIRPDVVKLDKSVVQGDPSVDAALVIDAVKTYADSSGAQVLAEGIENRRHRERANALGATLGQGWLFGYPEELRQSGASRMRERTSLIIPRQSIADETPLEALGERVQLETVTRGELLAMSRALERRAQESTEPCVVLATFQTAAAFTPQTARLYSDLGQRSAFVGAFGCGLAVDPVPGVRGASFAPDHPLAAEWDVVVVGPHFAAALVARDLGEDRYAFAVLHDREPVLRAARALMLKLAVAPAA